jgi:hypothetical protein
MEIKEATYKEFDEIFRVANHVFNKAAFNHLNKNRTAEVKYLIFNTDGKNKLGIIGGVKEDQFSSPFSSPFGGWVWSGGIELKELEDAYDLLEKYFNKSGVKKVKITMPPFFYNESDLALIWNVSARKGYNNVITDLNFQFDLSDFNENYLHSITYNARKNYKIGEREGLNFYKVTEPDKIKQAYDVIGENRKERGFPLKMSFEDVLKTLEIIKADFFIVTDNTRNNAAAAMVFHVTDKIVQVVYWGHLSAYSALKPINFLSYNLFQYYKKEGMEYVDIGPSTENSVPNYGLVEFKQSIGCIVSSKVTIQKNIS